MAVATMATVDTEDNTTWVLLNAQGPRSKRSRDDFAYQKHELLVATMTSVVCDTNLTTSTTLDNTQLTLNQLPHEQRYSGRHATLLASQSH